VKWSIRLGTFSGIAVYMHLTFVLFLVWIAAGHWLREHSIAAAVAGVGFVLAIFGCVVLHEFGHALMARRYGIRTRDITLLPIGGMARLERMPEDPRQELWVALAGPAVNVAIAAVLAVWVVVSGVVDPRGVLSMTGGPVVLRLLVVNAFLVAFNLIPAFPMDGGRVLRAILASQMEYTRATQIAAAIGQALAFAFGFLGLFTNPMLLFIALFVWIGAAQEAGVVQMRTALSGIPVSQAMLTDFAVLSPGSSLKEVVELTLKGSQKDYPVVQDDRVVGILTQSDLLAALSRADPETGISEVMQRDFQVVDALEMLETAFSRFDPSVCRTLPVLQRGRLVGLVTMDNVGEFLAIQAALRKGRTEGS
jgi:Zn-dependent protease